MDQITVKENEELIMKVLVITECYPRKEKEFSGVYLKQQFDEFQNLGHQIDVCILSNGQGTPLKKIDEPGFRYYSIGYTTNRYELFPTVKLRQYIRSLLFLAKDNQYDLISIHLVSDSALIATVKTARRLHIPVAVHFHGLNVWSNYATVHPFREKMYAIRRKRILNKTNLLVGVSDKVSDIIRKKIEKIPVATVYNGVDTLFFQPQTTIPDEFKIISVARLIPIKGLEDLIRSFSEFSWENKGVSLEIIGDGPEDKKLKETAKMCNVEKEVTFAGRLPYQIVSDKLRAGSVFVLPSYYEALGCVYLEAMACGLPAVGVKGMGIDEIIEDGVNGYTVPPHDEKALAQVMRTLYQDRALLEKMGKNARRTAERYSWANSAKELEKHYMECLKNA